MEIDRRAKILILHGLIYHLLVIDFSLTYIILTGTLGMQCFVREPRKNFRKNFTHPLQR